MIKVENIETWGFEHAIRGCRNAMNSWDRSDSISQLVWVDEGYRIPIGRELTKEDIVPAHWKTIKECKPVDISTEIGSNDLDLMQRLYKAGPEHRKYLRQIMVSMDITAPLYWISEFDTYKVGVTRNSCSFMHKGVSKPFEITDFSIHNEQVYEILSPLSLKKYDLVYPYDTDEYKIYECSNGRKYRVYKNGKIWSEPYSYSDTMGRTRTFKLTECKPSLTTSGYYEINLGGSKGREKWVVHRLVATVWLDNPYNLSTVNHINGDKGDNSVDNLEWCDLQDNIKKGFNNGLYERGKSIHAKYKKWKNGHILVSPYTKAQIFHDYAQGMTYKQIAKKYNLTDKQANGLISSRLYMNENLELFMECYTWESIIDTLNELRQEYLETKDNNIFQQIRCLLPCGYNQKFTITMNYENVVNIIHQRTGHKLDEWNNFVEILKELPYIKEIIGEKSDKDKQIPGQMAIDDFIKV